MFTGMTSFVSSVAAAKSDGFFFFVFGQQFFTIKDVSMFSDFLSVTSALRQIYNSCPNKAFILFNYINSGLGKFASSFLCTALYTDATLAYSQEFL